MRYLNTRSISIFVLILVCFSVLFYYLSSQRNTVKNIAFIRSAYLIENYQGMKEVLNKYNEEIARQQAQIDTLENRYVEMQEQFKRERRSLSATALREKEELLQRTLQHLSGLTDDINAKAQADKERLMQGALNQINQYVEQYAKEHDISLVLGVTVSGNVLYGEDHMDITEPVLTALNQQYK